ncbi:RING-type E3 ubiquitin transferase [Hirschfeldia incana]|nr:RING-type E3 ubiquitin transferase [Hirschfeldia incana]
MDDATAISYWCHMCSRSVDPVIEGEIINCNFCQSGFVEEMDETPDQVTNDDHPHHQAAADSLWAPILLGMMNDHDQNQRSSETNAEDDNDDDYDDGGDGDGQNNDGEFDLERHLEEIMRRRRRHSAAILDLLQGIRAGLSVESENNSEDSNQDSELVVLINSFNQRIRIQDSVDASSVPSGSLGDYFIGPGFEMLLQRLAENDPNNRYGTPPATKEAVESLDTVMVKEGLVQCTVCLDDFEIGVEAKEMPCKHKFHSECLLPWLELHSSCPVCRYLLPAGEDDGEAKTDAETSSNVSMENNGTSVDSSSNNPSVND